MRINLCPTAGRVGTSTIALALAHHMAKRFNSPVDIAVGDDQEVSELLYIMGLGTTTYRTDNGYQPEIMTSYGINIVQRFFSVADYSVGIHPKGQTYAKRDPLHTTSDIALLNTTYSSLATFMHCRDDDYDAIVVNRIPGTALTEKDAIQVCQVPMLGLWMHDAAIARSVDAGLFMSKVDALSELVDPIIDFAFAKVTQGNEQENAK